MIKQFLAIAYIFSFYVTIRFYNHPQYEVENGFIILEFSRKPTNRNTINGLKIFDFKIGK